MSRHPGEELLVTRQYHIPGEPGIWLLLFGELTVFASLFVAFLHFRNFDIAGFAAGQAHLSRGIGLLATLLLLTSSLLVASGVKQVETGDTVRGPRSFRLGLLCSAGFILLKAVEYARLISIGITPIGQPFFGFYFALTALHLGHVVVGSLFLIVISNVTRHPIGRPSRFALIESAGCFWHMVDLLWIAIFALLYLVE